MLIELPNEKSELISIIKDENKLNNFIRFLKSRIKTIYGFKESFDNKVGLEFYSSMQYFTPIGKGSSNDNFIRDNEMQDEKYKDGGIEFTITTVKITENYKIFILDRLLSSFVRFEKGDIIQDKNRKKYLILLLQDRENFVLENDLIQIRASKSLSNSGKLKEINWFRKISKLYLFHFQQKFSDLHPRLWFDIEEYLVGENYAKLWLEYDKNIPFRTIVSNEDAASFNLNEVNEILSYYSYADHADNPETAYLSYYKIIEFLMNKTNFKKKLYLSVHGIKINSDDLLSSYITEILNSIPPKEKYRLYNLLLIFFLKSNLNKYLKKLLIIKYNRNKLDFLKHFSSNLKFSDNKEVKNSELIFDFNKSYKMNSFILSLGNRIYSTRCSIAHFSSSSVNTKYIPYYDNIFLMREVRLIKIIVDAILNEIFKINGI
jgi:hypothetical protein